MYSGPYPQSLAGSDGVGDTLYVIDDVNRDYYPLKIPFVGSVLGDANHDGHVNLSDLSLLASYWFNIPVYNPAVDFNMNGFVNLSDLSILADHWFKGPLD